MKKIVVTKTENILERCSAYTSAFINNIKSIVELDRMRLLSLILAIQSLGSSWRTVSLR